MSQEMLVLAATAVSIGFLHTLLGPDHYLPFIALARAGKWSLTKTTVVTVLCGMGHVLSSVVLGLIGVAFGIAIGRLEALESFRGGLAGWSLLAFGLVYLVWGVRRAVRNRPHGHPHAHDGEGAAHTTPWILFIIFVFGPCEPLIPILMYPAAKGSMFGVVMVTAVFGVVTIGTMLGIVLTASLGLGRLRTQRLARYSHALAGATILLCGVAIQFVGL